MKVKASLCVALVLCGICLLYVSTKSVSADKLRPKIVESTGEDDKKLASLIRTLTNRSADGLRKQKLSDGSLTMNVDGRFQNLMVAKLESDGSVGSACVSGIEEADSFFDRDLDTGQPIYSTIFQKESVADVAQRHGMSPEDFEFYSKMIANATQDGNFVPQSSTINIVNADGAGEGFNSAAAPAVANEGGNPGATLGAQRLNLFNYAAGIWGSFLDSSIPINVNSQFNSIAPCSTSGGVLGNAGTVNIHANFTNTPNFNTWYPAALANKRAASDLVPANPEINATFNSDVDTGCLGVGTRFYYGLDNSTPPGTVNLLVVLLHEMGHGMGFQSFVSTLNITGAANASPIVITSSSHGLANGDQVSISGVGGNTAANGTWTVAGVTTNTFQLSGSTGNGAYTSGGIIRGANLSGLPDAWSRMLFDRTANKLWINMTTAERSASILNTGNLLWDGANVKLASGSLTAGRDVSNGQVQMFAPNPFQQGSSVSHFDTAASPNLLMEPVINTGLPTTLDLTRQAMRDIGWYRDTTADNVADTITNVTPSGGAITVGNTIVISWQNNGSFNRNVTIELSTDSGATYPTTIASNVANTGTYSWTVPSITTTNARLRVREYNFVDPVGASPADFVISATPTAQLISLDGRVRDAAGNSISRVAVSLTDSTGNTVTTYSNSFGYFRFDLLMPNHTYILRAVNRKYVFEPRTVSMGDNVTGFELVGSGG